MTNTAAALKIMIDYLESEGITINSKEAFRTITKWSNKFNDLDALSLAALAIADPNEIALTILEIRKIRDFFFSKENFIENKNCFIECF